MKITVTSDTKPHPDANGNIAAVTSPFRALAAKFSYDAFGRTTSQSGPKSGIDLHAIQHRFSTKPMELELATSNTTLVPPPASSGLYYYGYRFYSPNLGRWISRDPIREQGGQNLYYFIRNNSINLLDLFGLKDYKQGTDDPTITSDVGAGAWDSKEWKLSYVVLKKSIVNNIGIVWVGMPDAVEHIQHYFGNSGRDYNIRLQNMIDEVPSAKIIYNKEIKDAQKFIESLPNGAHNITSGNSAIGYNNKTENMNWFYAVGGYKAWGKGKATVCKDSYILEFEYKFYDRYNWDGGKQVTILGQVVTDQFMGEFHQQGLAHEFDMRGSVKKTIKWKKGEASNITEGWESEQEQGR